MKEIKKIQAAEKERSNVLWFLSLLATRYSLLAHACFLLLASCFLSFARADVASSTNFVIKDTEVGTLGGFSTSTDFQQVGSGFDVSSGESSSTSFTSQTGPLGSNFSPASQNWRFYDDETNETPVTPLANENVSPTDIKDQNIIKLRLTIKETAGVGLDGVKFKLQFSEYSDFSQGVFDVVESGSCLGVSTWCYADGAGVDNGIISTKVLSDADTCSGGVGDGCGTHNESGTSVSTSTQNVNAATEYEFTLKQAGARANATYFFRAYDTVNGSPVPLNTGATYPSLAAGGTILTFSVSGLPASTSTSGIVTSATTTPTDISFGTLAFGGDAKAAQRLLVTTNATQGYQIFAFQGQGLLNQGGSEIPPVVSTNATPLGWNSACTSTSTGCYGYHTNASVLSGGSTRFAPDDSYARFTTSSAEIAYSGGPVTSSTTDIVLRALARSAQDSGSYQSSLSYIVVPVF